VSYESLSKLDPSLYGEKVIDPRPSLKQIARMVPLSQDDQRSERRALVGSRRARGQYLLACLRRYQFVYEWPRAGRCAA
jgi:hypothetical protein